MSVAVEQRGVDRFIEDYTRTVHLDDYYKPYPMQQAYHASPVRHRLLGGAAGPGKTVALIMEHMMSCYEHESSIEARQVHTLLLRRTTPKLKTSVIQRFLEKVPRELYRSFNQQTGLVTWLNGADTRFGSAQHEKDIWTYQGGQYKAIDYDELTEFTLYQWIITDPWNRCPVAPSQKGGATNPVGVGALFCKALWIDKRPAPGMDDNQRALYNPGHYAYFPCTYLDNPIYATDPEWIAKLEALPAGLRDALKYGKWGTAMGSFFEMWDQALHVYRADSLEIEPWWPKWLSGDWGYEHPSAFHWHTTAPDGKTYTYREYVVNHTGPKQLAERIADLSIDAKGQPEKIDEFHFAHDAFAKRTDEDPIAQQMQQVLKQYRMHDGRRQFSDPEPSTRDVRGSGMLAHELLQHGKHQISDACAQLIDVIPSTPRDLEKDPESIAEFTGDDALKSWLYGLYGRLKAKRAPLEVRVEEQVQAAMAKAGRGEDPNVRYMATQKAMAEEQKRTRVLMPNRFRGSRSWRQ